MARVGSLPLALAQAASYMRETNTSMTEYLGFYNTAWDDLMTYEARPESALREYGNHSVRTTWTISFEGVKRKNEDAAKTLQVWSYLDNRDIWFEIFNNETSNNKLAEAENLFQRLLMGSQVDPNFKKTCYSLPWETFTGDKGS